MAIKTANHGAQQISSPGGFVEVVPVLDTNAYGDGDLLFGPVEVPQAVTWSGGYATLRDVEVLDEDAQGIAMTLLVLDADTSLGTVNDAFAASDELCRGIVALVPVAGNDYVALGSGAKRASLGGLDRIVQAAAGSTSLWIAGIARGTPTHSASGLRIRLGLVCA